MLPMRKRRWDRGRQRLFGIFKFGLSLGQGDGDLADAFARSLHQFYLRHSWSGWKRIADYHSRFVSSKLIAPDFARLERTPWPLTSLASSGTNTLSSVLARSCARKA